MYSSNSNNNGLLSHSSSNASLSSSMSSNSTLINLNNSNSINSINNLNNNSNNHNNTNRSIYMSSNNNNNNNNMNNNNNSIYNSSSNSLPDKIRAYIFYLYSQRGARLVSAFFILLFCTWIVAEILFASVADPSLIPSSDYDESSQRYGIFIDAGSSGSRIYIYTWPKDSVDGLVAIQQLRDSDGVAFVKKQEPGLSKYASNPSKAFESIYPLLNYASEHIPVSQHPATPVYIFGTAGLRMVPTDTRNAILHNLIQLIPEHFDFAFKADHVQVITGAWEGVFSWISVNYALNRLHSKTSSSVSSSFKKTAGALEMGGASLQITFEVAEETDVPKEYAVELNLGSGRNYQLYVATFLRYGANEARSRYLHELFYNEIAETNHDGIIEDPCLNINEKIDISGNELVARGIVEPDTVDAEKGVKLTGTGDFELCKKELYPLMNKTVPCLYESCSFNGVYQPPIPNNIDLYGFSEYYYTSNDVLDIAGAYDYAEFSALSQKWCTTDAVSNKNNPKYSKMGDRISLQCFKAAWMATVLHEGHGIPSGSTNFKTAESVGNIDVSWTLGAMIYYAQSKSWHNPAIDQDLGSTTSSVSQALFVGITLCILISIYIMARRRQRPMDVWDISRV